VLVPDPETRPESPLALVEGPEQVSGGPGAVRVLGFPLVAELRDGLLFAHGDEDRVVAEALVAARLDGDPALEGAGAAQLLAGRRQCEQRVRGPGTAAVALDVAELAEQAPDWIVAAKARR